MPVIIAILGAIAAAAFWYFRIRAVRDVAGNVLDAAGDARSLFRALGFRQRANAHPVDCIEDAKLAAMGIVAAIAEMDGPLSEREINTMTQQAQSVFGVDLKEAGEIVAFGRWIAGQCGSRSEAVRRLGNRLFDLAGVSASADLTRIIDSVAVAGELEADARLTLERIFSRG